MNNDATAPTIMVIDNDPANLRVLCVGKLYIRSF